MKRRTPSGGIKLLLFLLAGAIINVAVAWGCAAFSPFRDVSGAVSQSPTWHDDAIEWWRRSSPFERDVVPQQRFDSKPSLERCHVLVGDSMRTYSAAGFQLLTTSATAQGQSAIHLARADAGLPLLGMRAGRWTRIRADGTTDVVIQGIKYSPPVICNLQDELSFIMDGRYLPLRPIWPGFAINTIFYAAVLWVLFAVPGAVRRRVRIKRGQCAACGYSLRGGTSEKCPECGIENRST